MIAPPNSVIEKLKLKKPCSCYSETMKNLRGLNENLKFENKVLQERNYNLSFIVSDQITLKSKTSKMKEWVLLLP